jgi:hypothetical protein
MSWCGPTGPVTPRVRSSFILLRRSDKTLSLAMQDMAQLDVWTIENQEHSSCGV